MALGAAEIREFLERGFVHLGPVFSTAELGEIRAEYDRLTAEPMRLREDGKAPFEYAPLLHLRSETLCRHACHPTLVEAAMALVGADVRLYWDQAVSKPAGATSDVPWHQDNGYGPVKPEQFVTFTVALDATSEANGCLWIQPGSHLGGVREHRRTDTIFFRGDDRGESGVPVPQPDGDVLAFSSLTLHRSGPNTSGGPRRSWIVQMCDAATRHGETGRPFDDRLLLSEGGAILETPRRERPFDLGEVAREARETGWSEAS